MPFTNLTMLRILGVIDDTLKPRIVAAINAKRFTNIGAHDALANGFGYPVLRYETIRFYSNVYVGTAWRTDVKILAGGILRTAFNERIVEIEEQQGRALSKKDRQSVTDELKVELLSQTLKQTDIIQMCFDLSRGLLFIDSFDSKRIDAIIDAFALLGINLAKFSTVKQPAITMTQWLLNQQCPSAFEFDNVFVSLKLDNSYLKFKATKNTPIDLDALNNAMQNGYIVDSCQFLSCLNNAGDELCAFGSVNSDATQAFSFVLNSDLTFKVTSKAKPEYGVVPIDFAVNENIAKYGVLIADAIRGVAGSWFGGLNG